MEYDTNEDQAGHSLKFTGTDSTSQHESESKKASNDALDLPSRGIDLPSRDADLPSRSTDLSSKDTNLPSRSTDSPHRTTDPCSKDTDLPSRNTDLPSRNTDLLSRNTGSPSKDTDSPSRSADSPLETTDSPSKGTDIPKGTDLPSGNTDIPSKGTDLPSKGSDLPSKGTDSPSKGTHSPSRNNDSRSKGTAHTSVRYLSFNVNGANTVLNYTPFNKHKNWDTAFADDLKADVISLQELKLSPSNIQQSNLAHLKNYKSYISLPDSKKGYSGVGLFVRIPHPSKDSPQVCHHLSVTKVEMGLSGHLTHPALKKKYIDLPEDESIGGYDYSLDSDLATSLIDHQGRCVIVELANEYVVFSVYCPANSNLSSHGDEQRWLFLSTLFRRCYKLRQRGKKVVVMGDINVCLNLIDHADALHNYHKAMKLVINDNFETEHWQLCQEFVKSSRFRLLFNKYVKEGGTTVIDSSDENDDDSLDAANLAADPTISPIFYDTTRVVQGRRRQMYSVWNTLTNARQSNYGSRIDFVLTTDTTLAHAATDSDILPYVYGSDHCPVFTDFDLSRQTADGLAADASTNRTSASEAKFYYKLGNRVDISSMFKMRRSPGATDQSKSPTPDASHVTAPSSQLPNAMGTSKRPASATSNYQSRKKRAKPSSAGTAQPSIENFFGKKSTPPTTSSIPPSSSCSSSSSSSLTPAPAEVSISSHPQNSTPFSITSLSTIYGEPPRCHHDLSCALKTCLSNNNPKKGKKFWCCGKNNDKKKQPDHDNEAQCNFFQWINK